MKGNAIDSIAVGALKVGSRYPHNTKSGQKFRSTYMLPLTLISCSYVHHI